MGEFRGESSGEQDGDGDDRCGYSELVRWWTSGQRRYASVGSTGECAAGIKGKQMKYSKEQKLKRNEGQKKRP